MAQGAAISWCILKPMSARRGVESLVSQAIHSYYKIKFTPEVTYAEERFGDFSTNAAYQLAPLLAKSPQEVATGLTEAIKHKDVAKATQSAGFINLQMTDEYWIKQLKLINKNYLAQDTGQGKSVQVEFISANPTGPLTLANGRGGYSGDVLANVLAACGYRVEREYYLNDGGNQIKNLVASLAGKESGEGPAYRGDYVKELAEELKSKLKTADDDKVGTAAVKLVVERYIKPAVEKMGIKFDNWFSELENLYKNDAQAIKKTLADLETASAVESKDGAKWLKSKDKDQPNRVLVKSDGTYTYLLVDLAYHQNKFAIRGFDKVINLWGADHAGQVGSLKDGIRALGIQNPLDLVIFQMVRLMRAGTEQKMSKRAGTYVTIDELLAEIEPDVARWFFVSRDFNTHMDFDLELAKEQSQKNPYHYVMYAYVRAQSVLKKAQKQKLTPAKTITTVSNIEKALIKHLDRLPDLLSEVAQSYEVHRLTFYGTELAKLFHDYYERERIIDAAPEVAAQKLYVVAKTLAALDAYWAILGITPKQRM